MTVIAAYYDGETYSLSTDSAGVEYNCLTDLKQSKIINKGKYYIGFTYSFRVADLITEDDRFPKQMRNINDVRKFRDRLQSILKEAGAIDKATRTDEMLSHPVGLVFVSPFGMWEIQGSYQIMRPKHYTATGSGLYFAYGALFAAHQLGLDAKTATELAVKSAIEHCTTCGGKCYTKTFAKEQ